jgi:hypothetical protein
MRLVYGSQLVQSPYKGLPRGWTPDALGIPQLCSGRSPTKFHNYTSLSLDLNIKVWANTYGDGNDRVFKFE